MLKEFWIISSRLIISENVNMYVYIYIHIYIYIILRKAERILDHFLASDYFGKRKYVCIYIYNIT